MPATYAAAYSVFRELPPLGARSILDVGAGTGAASLAARGFFPEARITMIERDRAFADAATSWLPDAEVRIEDAGGGAGLPMHDVVVAAYSLGEVGAAGGRAAGGAGGGGGAGLPMHDVVVAAYSLGEVGAAAARRLWEAAEVALVIIEPGTP